MPDHSYDALLIISFGGPERREDVLPFLENVVRGRRIPRERLLEVAAHYYHLGGASPLNAHVRDLSAAVQQELRAVGVQLPVYWGNRNWHPFLPDTLRQMADDGVRRALAWVTSAYSSYSSCRQYLENIAAARAEVGPQAPQVDKIRAFYNHPAFIEAQADRVGEALDQIPPQVRERTWLLYTAHSLPMAMAESSDYVQQLEETCRLISQRIGHRSYRLVYQSRSGPPHQPWLEPDVCDAVEQLHAARAVSHLVVVPVGFLSDHVEVLWDLDVEARQSAQGFGIQMVRAATVGTHPRFVRMIRDLILERLEPGRPRLAVGRYGAHHDECPADCCPSGVARSGSG